MAAENPFVDPNTSEEQAREASFTRDSTLAVGRDASLTLGTDSLIVLDEALEEKSRGVCCGFWPAGKNFSFHVMHHYVILSYVFSSME